MQTDLIGGVTKTHPAHLCKDSANEVWHNQAELAYFSCGICGRVTHFAYKGLWRRIKSLFHSATKQ